MIDHAHFDALRSQAAKDRDDAIWQANFDYENDMRRIDEEETAAKAKELAEEVRHAKAVWYGDTGVAGK